MKSSRFKHTGCLYLSGLPPVEVSMLVGSHTKAGKPLGAGSHHKEFSDPLCLRKDKYTVMKSCL